MLFQRFHQGLRSLRRQHKTVGSSTIRHLCPDLRVSNIISPFHTETRSHFFFRADKSPEADVVAAAARLKDLGVVLYEVPITGFQWDSDFQTEIRDIYNQFGPEQAHVYQVHDYSHLSTSNLAQDVRYDAGNHSFCGQQRCIADIALLVDQSTTITFPTYQQYVSTYAAIASLDASGERMDCFRSFHS